LDGLTGLPVVLQDSDGNRYVYGLDLLTRINGMDEEWYLDDGLGSTTGLADDTGAITGSYEHDVFGAVRAQSGDATEWSYTGEQHDSTGLEYLRARYYDASIGRFASQDPLPLLQRYGYVNGNPVNLTDPTGQFPCPGCGKVKSAVSSTVDATVDVATTVVRNKYVQQCAVWGVGGAIAGAPTVAGIAAGAAGGCAAGVASRAWVKHVSNDPVSQCVIWAAGGTIASRGIGLLTAGGCVAGALSWYDSTHGFNNFLSQCGTWGASAFRFVRGDIRTRLLAGVPACAAGGISNLLTDDGKESARG